MSFTSRRYFKGYVFWIIKQWKVNYGSWSFKFILIHSCNSLTSFGSLLRKIPLKRNFPSRISSNIWTICVFQPLFIAISHMRQFISRGGKYFWLDLVFARLIISIRKVATSVKFISSNHYYSMTTIMFRIFLLCCWMCGLILFPIMYYQTIYPTRNLLNVCN